MIKDEYLEAKKMFLSGDFITPKLIFNKYNFSLEEGYCELLSQNIERAVICFLKIRQIDLRADWALKIIQFIKNEVTIIPSYFQVRNFLEIDLNLFINADLRDYVESVINGADLLFKVNPESYKFIARVMIYNGYDGIAFHYLKKAKDSFYHDPELHLMLAGCFKRAGELVLAKKSALNCLNVLPNYFPAKLFLENLARNV